ncbi:MAG: hypothetical protein Q9214_000217 [Letrouitia sp. 1 TL-2023]
MMRLSIVAIHGLNEDYNSAWLDPSSGTLWLRDLLPEYLYSARILLYGYTADAALSAPERPSDRILQHAQTLVAELEADRSGNNAARRPLIFVCHGIGGVILKRALAYSSSRVSKKVEHLYSVFVSTYGILFFGTPHEGLDKDGQLMFASDEDAEQSQIFHASSRNSETLQNINDSFMPLMKQFHVHFFWEQQGTRSKSGSILRVDESTAAPVYDDTERSGIEATHSQMCKFANVSAPGFSVVIATLRRYAHSANAVISRRWVHALESLEQLRHNEAAELVGADGLSTDTPIVYEKHSLTSRNRHFRVPYSASSIFTGRKDIFVRLEESILASGTHETSQVQKRFVLYGLGGSGKTQFCLKFVQDHRQSFWGIFWIDASTVENAEQGFASIAEIGGAGHSFIDNADDPSIDVSRFFPPGDRGHILLTSRNTECRYHETVGYQELKEMEKNEAITLLLRAAGKNHSDPKNRKLAGPIAQALGYLPLALDQAGASIRRNICSLKSYLTVYNRWRRQIMGRREIQGSEAYKYTVYTTWEVSFQMLKKLGETAAADASEILQIPIEKIDDENSSLPRLLHQEGPQWDTIRIRKALALLEQFSLISRDVHPEEESSSPSPSSDSSENHIEAESYSMHPLVHYWARDRIPVTEQRLWFETTATTLAKSITGRNEPSEQAYRRTLLPHIDFLLEEDYGSPLLGPDADISEIKIVSRLTDVYSECGRWNSARTLQEKVLQRRKAVHGLDHPDTLTAISSLGTTYWNSGMVTKALDLRRQELDQKIRLWGPKNMETLKAMDHLADTYWLSGRYAEAEEMGLKTVTEMKKSLNLTNPLLVRASTHLARAYKHSGQPEKALRIMSPIAEDCEKELGPEHEVVVNAQADLGMIYHEINQLSLAETKLQAVLNTRKRVLGEGHPYTMWAINDLAKILTSQGRAFEAEGMLTAILDTVRHVLGPEHVGMTMTLTNIVTACSSQGRFEQVDSMLSELRRIFTQKIKTREIDSLHPDYLFFLYQSARNRSQQGRIHEAERGFKELLPLCEEKLGTGHPRTQSVRARLKEMTLSQQRRTPTLQPVASEHVNLKHIQHKSVTL